MTGRIIFIDAARAHAILLALTVHALSTFGGLAHLGENFWVVRIFTHSATPMFIFMCGMMIEIVYVRKAEVSGTSSVAGRLLVRSFQCYLGYCLIVSAGFFAGSFDAARAIKAFLFLDNSHFGNILRFYSIVLLLAVPLIFFRVRYGFITNILLLAIILLGFLYLPAGGSILRSPFDHWELILVGSSTKSYGPSVWHGMTFISCGMILAFSLVSSQDMKKFYFTLAVMTAVAFLLLVYIFNQYSVHEILKDFVMAKLRGQNHFGYYVIGIILCFFYLLLFSLFFRQEGKVGLFSRMLLSLGKHSLFSYTLGNIILNLLRHENPTYTLTALLGYTICFLFIMVIITASLSSFLHDIPKIIRRPGSESSQI
jgi:hypothetical protein